MSLKKIIIIIISVVLIAILTVAVIIAGLAMLVMAICGGSDGGGVAVLGIPVIIGLVTLIGILAKNAFKAEKSNNVAARPDTPQRFSREETIVREYIIKARAAGMAEEEIKGELLSALWPEEMINKMLAIQG